MVRRQFNTKENILDVCKVYITETKKSTQRGGVWIDCGMAYVWANAVA